MVRIRNRRYCHLQTASFLFLTILGSALNASAQTENGIQKGDQAGSAPATDQFGHSRQWAITQKSLPDAWFVRTFDGGKGLSQIVGDNNLMFVASGERTPSPDDPKANVNATITAYETSSLKVRWSKTFESAMRKQETFGAAGPSAQATPLLIDGKLIHLTFTGNLICLDQQTGELQWQTDLVEKLGATPVQFGFSSSPVADPDAPGRLVVLAAGPEAGLFRFDVTSGKVVSKTNVTTFSYATPVAATLCGRKQWIVVSQNEVLGIARDNGQQLWSHPLAEKGLTNVPTPLVVDEQHVLISGQGVKGTRCLKIDNQKSWSAEEIWFQRQIQLFYTNWIQLDERVIVACTDKFLGAFDCKTGQVLGRFRGFGDGNLVRSSDGKLMLLDGKGRMSVLVVESNPQQAIQLKLTQSFAFDQAIPNARCWTPISELGSTLATRSQDRVVLLNRKSVPNSERFENNRTEPKIYKLETIQDQAKANSQPSGFDQILEQFGSAGPEAALQLYTQLRNQKKLTVDDRVKLIQAARAEGMPDQAEQFLKHAREDFPGDDRWGKLLDDQVD